jgi:transcriptional regulator with XRE-family HTH domain
MRHNTSKGHVNNQLREARLQHGWSQQQVADLLGTTTNNVSRWELGRTTPGPYFRNKLCILYSTSYLKIYAPLLIFYAYQKKVNVMTVSLPQSDNGLLIILVGCSF